MFSCPCRQGHLVMLNLDVDHSPRWRITTRMPLTLFPSVDERSRAGRCHYIIKDGHIQWVERRGPQD
ncbi:DUF6527 family protein [Herbiconiux sp.]|uniref:DUF6527 family protein n=1 Tax=Herbiconiux sp. TaxID=1871186 RepID=UPI00344DC74E